MKPFVGVVPKGQRANRQYRADLLRHAAGSEEARAYLKDLSKYDILFYFNAFLWTFDPRLPDDKTIPFITYPFQDWATTKIEAAIEHRHDLVIEKSRDVGASWFCMGVLEHRWHFLRDQTFLCISRTEEKVDSFGDRGSLFGKLDFIHRHLPPWLVPRGYPGEGKKQCRKALMFENPETGSTINGSATVGAAGVGDRMTAILIDEFSRIDNGDEIDLGTQDTSPCRIFNFTAYGEGNAADRIRKDPHKKKLRLVWWMDPRKNKKLYQWDGDRQRVKYLRCNENMELEETAPHEYTAEDDDNLNVPDGAPPRPFVPERDGRVRSPVYDREFTRRANPRWMAINWDIDYTLSDNKFFDMALIRELDAECVRPPAWEGDAIVDEGTGDLVELVEKAGGPLKLWCRLQGASGELRPRPSELGYGGGCDISYGRGSSNSCLSVADADTGEKVAEFVTPHLSPERFAAKCVALGRMFVSTAGSPMLLMIERLGPGEVFKDKVLEMNYPRVYYSESNGPSGVRSMSSLGWSPTAAGRAVLFDEYESALRQRRFTNRSTLALRECADFLRVGSGCEHAYGRRASGRKSVAAVETSGSKSNHGDRVTADALANRTLVQLGRPNFGKAEAEAEAAEAFGTLSWRIAEHRRRDKARRGNWG